MAKPPVYPIISPNGSKTNYFQLLVRMASEYLKEDGIQLNFQGYTETLIEYASLKENEAEKAWNLAQELNAWAEYMSSIANLVQKLYLDAETEKNEIKSIASVEADKNKVANGDRLSNQDPKVVMARKKRNTLKAFYEELESKVKFLERAHYHCKATYENKMRSIHMAQSPSPSSSSN